MPAVCSLCNKTYASIHSLASHNSRYHSKKAEKNLQEKFLKCRICKTMYSNSYSLQSHISRYHSKRHDSKSKKQRIIKIFTDQLWIHNQFQDRDVDELGRQIEKLRHAVSAVLTLFKFKKEIPYQEELLHKILSASQSRGEKLLYQHYDKLERVFRAIDPKEIKQFIFDVDNGVIPLKK